MLRRLPEVPPDSSPLNGGTVRNLTRGNPPGPATPVLTVV